MKELGIYFFVYLLIFASCEFEPSDAKYKPTSAVNDLNGGLFLPDGFSANVFVDSIGPSRHIAVRDNGDVYVKLRVDTGTMGNVALRDIDNDNRADIIERWGNYPNDGSFATAMRIHDGYIYFSSEHLVCRQKLTPDKLVPDGNPEMIVVDPYPIRWHNAKAIAFDGQGNIFVTFSAPTNVCEDWKSVPPGTVANVKGENPCSQLDILGGIWKFKVDVENQSPVNTERYATGIRSVVAMAWNEDDNKLYAINHGRDYLYGHAPQFYSQWDNTVIPAEQFMIIEEGDNFGWPYSYWDILKKKRMIAPEYGGDGILSTTEYKDPIMGLPAHWAPNDLLFYKGDQFPSRYKDGAFVAFHGSTNRTPYPQAGYVVAFIPFENGSPSEELEIFADGFAGIDTIVKMEDARFRPMGLSEGPDGSLFISESKIGRIWKVTFQGNKENFGPDQLAEMETRKGRSYIKTPVEGVDEIKK